MIFTFYKIIKLILFTSIKIDLIFFYYGGFMFVSIFLLASFKIAYVFPLRTLSLYIKFLVFLFIKNFSNIFIKPYCKTVALPLEYYPNGNIFYVFSEQLTETAIMVHFNWIVGHAKIEKMKKHNLWLLTEEETSLEHKLV